jgi:hypothetical protein
MDGNDMQNSKLLIGIMTLAFFIAGCAMRDAGVTDNQPADTSSTSASTSSAAGSTAPAPPPVKMVAEFDDIPVPADLKRNDDLSFVYEAPGVTMGVITYSGYYKGASVAKFYRTQMPTYGWQFLNAFSESNKFMVAFLKANRSCIINIDEGAISTKVTIKVGPTSATTGAPNLRYEVGH